MLGTSGGCVKLTAAFVEVKVKGERVDLLLNGGNKGGRVTILLIMGGMRSGTVGG